MSRSRAPIAFNTPISRRRSRIAASSAFVMPSAAIANAMSPMPASTISTTRR